MSVQDVERRLGQLFAEYLTRRGSAAALRLADGLFDAGDTVRAEFLRSFATDGPQDLPADWWQPGATCRLSLDLPSEPAVGHLWFDPLEVAWSLAVPWLDPRPTDPPFAGWIGIEPVTGWQVRGAHEVAGGIPHFHRLMSGDGSTRYGSLFGKGTTHRVDWLFLRAAYGDSTVVRVWGPDERQFGGGGAISGSIEVLQLNDVLDDAVFEPEQISDLEPVGFSFRAMASIPDGLWRDAEALNRVWTR